ncbi:hypothetical protein J3R30DRAFT_1604068 [Lentinula aciculospora]|uniref:Uncharacterized protein n=1 Tax=Lentinula aciculospora TaxID=153920 RepID=A0A9W8ZXF9_9AGAR|nr:hypothetical protein J3R30DRAFT_1604068 [Lentinula aciculospora]
MSSYSLSYADRAKKAQKIRSPIENTLHVVSVSMSESASVSSPFSSNASSTSSTSSNAGSSTIISSNSTDIDAADVTAPTTSNSSVIVESDGECNGDQQEQKEKEYEESRIVTRKPSVNVWQQRMADVTLPGLKRDSISFSSTLKPSSSKSTTNGTLTKKDDNSFGVKARPTSNNCAARPLAPPSRPTTKSEKSLSLDFRDSNTWPEVGVELHRLGKDKGKGKLSNEEEAIFTANLSSLTRVIPLFVSNTNYLVYAFQKTKTRAWALLNR